jgi:drug/metabolite transporter (DMT)-like permease
VITVVLSLTAAVGWAFHDFLAQPVTRRAGAFTAMFWVLAASTVILMAFSLALGGVPSGGDEWRAIGVAAVGGVLYVLAVAALLHGLQVGKLSVVTPLCSLMGGVTALAVILLGERVNTLSAVALPLAVVGVLLTSLVTPEEEAVEEAARGLVAPGEDPEGVEAAAARRRLRATAGAGWGLLAAVLFGTTFLIYGWADGIPAVSAAAWGRLTGMAVFLPFALLRVPLRMQPRLYVSTTVAGALDSAAYTAIAAALVIGPVSVASVLSAQFATIALLLGVIVRHERLAAHQIVGLVCTIAAVTLFALAA